MNTSDLKLNLINAISKTDNPILLMEINKLIDISIEDSSVYKLDKEQKKAIKIAKEQIKRGEFLSHEEAKKQTKEWLKD